MTATAAARAVLPAKSGTQPAKVPLRRDSESLGWVENPEAFFEEAKQEMVTAVGDLSNFAVPLNRILVMIYVRPKTRKLPGGLEIIIPDSVVDEDKWQGVTALVLKLGPHCYEPNEQITFLDADHCKVGDWVMFRRGEGFRLRIWKQECVMLESERGIKMILPRPDAVF